MEECGGGERVTKENSSNSPCYSRDSAIDSDLAEWEIETLELNMVIL